MTELEKIQYTKTFIDKLAGGINPLNDEPIAETDLLNNVRIARCMFYVSGILDNVCKQLSAPAQKKKKRNADKARFCLSEEQLQQFEYKENGMYVGEIARELNSLIDLNEMQRIKVKSIFEWLVYEKLLCTYVTENGKEYKSVTDEGKLMGLSEEMRFGASGVKYTVINCDKKAQQYIVEHSNIIAESDVDSEVKNNVPSAGLEFQGKVWEPEQDKQLIDLYNDGLVADEIAKELKRTPVAIRARLVRLGIIKNRNELI